MAVIQSSPVSRGGHENQERPLAIKSSKLTVVRRWCSALLTINQVIYITRNIMCLKCVRLWSALTTCSCDVRVTTSDKWIRKQTKKYILNRLENTETLTRPRNQWFCQFWCVTALMCKWFTRAWKRLHRCVDEEWFWNPSTAPTQIEL